MSTSLYSSLEPCRMQSIMSSSLVTGRQIPCDRIGNSRDGLRKSPTQISNPGSPACRTVLSGCLQFPG